MYRSLKPEKLLEEVRINGRIREDLTDVQGGALTMKKMRCLRVLLKQGTQHGQSTLQNSPTPKILAMTWIRLEMLLRPMKRSKKHFMGKKVLQRTKTHLVPSENYSAKIKRKEGWAFTGLLLYSSISMTSLPPMYSWSGSGILIPSSVWLFSTIAVITLSVAHAVAFSV